MPPLPITSLTAALLALGLILLTFRTVQSRAKTGASLGDGRAGIVKAGEEHLYPLLVATRSHANFCEFVPLSLILLGLVERQLAPRWLTLLLAALLIVSRVLHPIGMSRKIPNPFRAGGMIGNLTMLLIAAIFLLVRAATGLG